MMMKNTKTPRSKDYKSETLGREILKKINQIGEKTYKLKKDVNGICGLVLSKPGATMFVEGHKAELWKVASDDFSQFSQERCLLSGIIPFHFFLWGACAEFKFLVEVR